MSIFGDRGLYTPFNQSHRHHEKTGSGTDKHGNGIRAGSNSGLTISGCGPDSRNNIRRSLHESPASEPWRWGDGDEPDVASLEQITAPSNGTTRYCTASM